VLMVLDFGFRVYGLWFSVDDVGFRISDFGFRVCCYMRNHAFVLVPYYEPRAPQLPPARVFVLGMKSGNLSSILGLIHPFMGDYSSLRLIVSPYKPGGNRSPFHA
jgi:hypothetical protein